MSINSRIKTASCFSVQKKLFLFIIAILLANIFLLFLLGSTTFEQLYTQHKIQELKNGAAEIKSAYAQGVDSETYNTALRTVENKNIIVRVFHKSTDNKIKLDYFTRMGFNPMEREKPKGRFYKPFIKEALNEFYAQGLDIKLQNEKYVIYQGSKQYYHNSILLYTAMNDKTYLALDTPRRYIAETAEFAIKSCIIISLLTLTVGSVVLYFICRKMTSPITDIQKTAERIANLDFSARCTVHSNDEIGKLAQAINNMSDSLQKNISELENTNLILRNDLHKQEQQDMMRKRFIANVSHDFKTPLTLITSYAENIKELDGNQLELRDEYCGIISSEGYKMAHLVHMLLSLSRLESGMVQLSKMAFSINEIILETIRRHALPAEKKHLVIERDLPDEIIVHADFQRIEQAFINLFENAVKYTPAGGSIKVSTQRLDGQCIVRIYNTGSPISQDDLDKLFISFYRIDESRSFNLQSYGLGLAIVRSIMELHKQEYGAHNVPGGVEFWFKLDTAAIDETDDEDI
ncbi:signal transduction histidine kinase [Hydrogenoanaerobacterium saccharovorans]|uniref:histidine kinase n=1 Tax=Hydrogenoanaerobacterium saccharovorans TaxID=474960 RepID=A0A1H8DJ31_9FIRM|nr:HAMP domain-containing sensor histidine kinase [Hydrogenoanaerobacterium saccharovorans]RPF42238.1 signal transduction histidine kinase [Hydrogenoanaerobacterium saccharovorans]SEN07331.1 Signal transduction histidine kinase [Hydrogenoanaerobacterium saccharovorans]